MKMNSGNYNRKITICKDKKGFNRDSGRDEDETELEELRTVSAKVRHISGKEYFAAAATESENTVEFKMRYQPDMEINQKHIVLYKGKKHNIKSVNDVDGGRKELILICEEV